MGNKRELDKCQSQCSIHYANRQPDNEIIA